MGALPNTLIIGAQKAGTSSLFAWLSNHPQVRTSFIKEVHYFDLQFDRGEAWYRSHFPLNSAGAAVIEASPYYLFHPLAPERAFRLLPDARLIVLLRDPVDRAYSHFQHNVALGIETLTFEAALDGEDERLGTSEQDLRSGRCDRSYAHQHYSYVARGRYAPQIERWLACFPRNQFLFLSFEELCTRPADTFSKSCDFLGLPTTGSLHFPVGNRRDYADLPTGQRASLSSRFADCVRNVEALTGLSFARPESLAGVPPC